MRANIKRSTNALFVLIVLCLSLPTIAQEEQIPTVVEGHVVAYEKVTRCSGCVGDQGIGVQLEYWIARIDDPSGMLPEYVLIKYLMYKSSPDTSIFNGRINFQIDRKLPLNESKQCVPAPGFDEARASEVTLSSYVITKPGQDAEIPGELLTMPCLVVITPPTVVKEPVAPPGT